MSSLPVQQPSVDSSSVGTQLKGRDLSIDYLRAFIIILVVFLHAALAYTSFSTYDEMHWIKSSAPVVDSVRWPLLDWPILWLDTFFMSLLFLVSGLFTISSLERRGSRDFFIARLKRLGIPFAVGAVLIAPIAFLPSYLLAAPETTQAPYLATFFTSDGWPVGPPWFIWMLLLFNGLVALTYRYAPYLLVKLRRQPSALVILLVTIAAFLPFRLIAPHHWWVSFGLFDFQPVRVVLYLAYFLLGVAIGTGEQWQKVGWPKLWIVWLIVGFPVFFVYMVLLGEVVPLPDLVSRLLIGLTYAICCTCASLACLGIFRRFVRKSNPFFDHLSADSYGIYLIHYGVVLWLQFALLPVSWPAWAKFSVAFVGGFALSWGVTRLLRQIPAVRRVL
jgi:glucan biosynthesis protein C